MDKTKIIANFPIRFDGQNGQVKTKKSKKWRSPPKIISMSLEQNAEDEVKLIDALSIQSNTITFGQQVLVIEELKSAFKKFIEMILEESNLSKEHFYGKVSGRVLNWTLDSFLKRCKTEGIF